MAPFRQLFTFIFLNGDFDIAENFFADAADGTTQSINGLGCVEVEHRHEVLQAKVGIFCQTTPGQQHIGGADGCGVEECHAFVIVMILLQIRTVNDVEDILLVGEEVFRDFHRGNLFQEVRKAARITNIVLQLQRIGNDLFMLRAEIPEVGAAGTLRGAGVCHIEHIFQLRSVPGVVDKSDAFRTPANITTHSFVPQFIIRTGGGFRALGVDHKLFVIGVLV